MNERISQIIDTLGIKKIEFAKKLGISSPFVSELCSGAKKASDRTIGDICREFNVSETWLRTGEGEMFRQDGNSAVDRLCAELHASELEAEIIRAYFRIDERIRLPFLRQLIQEVRYRPIELDTTRQERTDPDIAAELAELKRQNQEKDKQLQELAAKVAAMEEEEMDTDSDTSNSKPA